MFFRVNLFSYFKTLSNEFFLKKDISNCEKKIQLFDTMLGETPSSMSEGEKIEAMNSFLKNVKPIDRSDFITNDTEYKAEMLKGMISGTVCGGHSNEYDYTISINFFNYLIINMVPYVYLEKITIEVAKHTYFPVFEDQEDSNPWPLTYEKKYNNNDFNWQVEYGIESDEFIILFNELGKNIFNNEELFKKLWPKVHEDVYDFSDDLCPNVDIMEDIIKSVKDEDSLLKNMKKLKYLCFFEVKSDDNKTNLIDHDWTDKNFYTTNNICDPQKDNRNPYQIVVYCLLLFNF